MDDVLRDLTYETAKGYVGDIFQIRVENGPTIDLKLDEVQLLMEKHVNPRMKRDAFALHFLGPLNPRLQQASVPLHHSAFGAPVTMFLVPIGMDADGVLYEAVFT